MAPTRPTRELHQRIRQLEAEVARMRSERDHYRDERHTFIQERDAARAEVARLREENERLQEWDALFAAVISGTSYWPNDWSQDVAAMAFFLHKFIEERDALRRAVEEAAEALVQADNYLHGVRGAGSGKREIRDIEKRLRTALNKEQP